MIKGTILKGTDTVLVVGLAPKNFARFAKMAPVPGDVRGVLLCSAGTEAQVNDHLKSIGLLWKIKTFEVPKASQKPAKKLKGRVK